MVDLGLTSVAENGEETFRSIEEWIAQQRLPSKPAMQAVDTAKSLTGPEAPRCSNMEHASPSVENSKAAPPVRVIVSSQNEKRSDAAIKHSFGGRELIFSTVGALLIALVVGGTWKIYADSQTENLIKTSASWLTSRFNAARPEARSSPQTGTGLTDYAPQVSAHGDEVTELKQQVSALVNALAVMRRDIEQLSVRDEQLTRDIASIQAPTEQASSPNQPAPSQAAPTATRTTPASGSHQKKVPRTVHADTPNQPVVVPPSPATTSPPRSLVEQPPRPPLPVPTATETPSVGR